MRVQVIDTPLSEVDADLLAVLLFEGDELPEPLSSAARRVASRAGPAEAARSISRSINVTDDLLVLAHPRRDGDGRIRLDPPDGGYLVTNLDLDAAMRLLGGRHHRVAALGVIGVGVGTVLAAIATAAAIGVALFG